MDRHLHIGAWCGSALLAAAALMGMFAAGCILQESDTVAADAPDPIEESVVIPDGAPDELIEIIETASRDAMAMSDEFAKGLTNRAVKDQFKRHVFTGVKAAEKLLDHPDCNEDQQEFARQAALALLYLGVEHETDAFERRFAQFVDRLRADDPGSEEAALGWACLIERNYIADRPEKYEVLPVLVEFAEAHPTHDAGVDLFRKAAEKMETRGDFEGAESLYRRAIDLYGDHPAIDPLRQRLDGITAQHTRSAAHREGERREAEARVREIKALLGNQETGYFVLYGKENPKLPRHGGMYMYRYEYEVVNGLEGVVGYERKLAERWSWKLVERFPATPAGMQKALQRRDSLYKKKRGKGKQAE